MKKKLFGGKESGPEIGSDSDTIVAFYEHGRAKKVLGLLFFIAILVVISGYAMGMGSYSISLTEVYGVIWEHLTHMSDGITSLDMRVVWDARLPRLLTALVAGTGLAAAGACMQSMLKNPLADPYTTGISSGASFGATIAIVLGITIGGSGGIVVNAFVFSLIPTAVILLLSTLKKSSPTTMILAGISVMYVFNALTSWLMLTADETQMAAAYEWTIGTLNKGSWTTLPAMFAVTAAGSLAILFSTKYLNAMNAGDDFAKTLGVNVNKIRIILLGVVSVVAAGIVSFTGVIGFVGLVAPHMARILIGSDNKLLIPGSMICGAIMMVGCDIISKMFTTSALPIGIITSLIGGPIFLILIMRQRKEAW
jgi:iron complex transport system permease protein